MQNCWPKWWPQAVFLHSFTHTSHPTHSHCNHLEWCEHRGSVFAGGFHHPRLGFCPLRPLPHVWHDKQSPHPPMALRMCVSPCLRWRTSVCICVNLCTCTCADVFSFKASMWRTGRWSCRVTTDVRRFPFPYPLLLLICHQSQGTLLPPHATVHFLCWKGRVDVLTLSASHPELPYITMNGTYVKLPLDACISHLG